MLKKILLALLLALPLVRIDAPKPIAQDPFPGCYPCSEPTRPGGNLV